MMQALQTTVILFPTIILTYIVCSYIFDRLTLPSSKAHPDKPHQRPAE